MSPRTLSQNRCVFWYFSIQPVFLIDVHCSAFLICLGIFFKRNWCHKNVHALVCLRFLPYFSGQCIFELRYDKINKMAVRPAKTQISLGIRPVWSESSLCVQWVAKNPSFLHADSEDWSDWMDAQADLSLHCALLILLVLSCCSSFWLRMWPVSQFEKLLQMKRKKRF